MTSGVRAILVTGASTGIGHHLTCRLAELGHTVFAGARKLADLAALAGITNVVPLPLDVRNAEQIAFAVERVRAHGPGLAGLVNNAGLGGLGPFVTWSEDELLEMFDVNALAPIRMTRAFLPLLLEAGGRIVNIGSQGGSISMRYFGPYTMTKHALEALTVALDQELAPAGVRVSIVQPGGVVSAIGDNSLPGTTARFRRAQPPFDTEAAGVLDGMLESDPTADAPASVSAADEPESATNRKPSSPEIVTVAVLDALFSDKPRLRYLVGTRWEGGRVLRALLEKLLDANDCPALGYSREELIRLFDEVANAR